MLPDIYQHKTVLKHPLTNDEMDELDNAWKFLSYFKTSYEFVSEYRKYIIDTIRDNYTLELFYRYEIIIEKLFWNLRWLLFPIWEHQDITEEEYWNFVREGYGHLDEIPNYLLLCHSENYKDKDDLNRKINNSLLQRKSYYRSFINKIFVIDYDNKRLITKPFEGSSDIFAKNYFNLQTTTILTNRKLYEKVMKNPFYVRDNKLKLPEFYYQLDYAFPNLNYCIYDIGTPKYKKKRIFQMYYTRKTNPEKYWYKIIKDEK